MPDVDPNEFTDREKFILSYYRDRDLSGIRRGTIYDIMVVSLSIFCLIMAAISNDSALDFVGYALILGRLGYFVIEGGRWARDFQGIFRKYDAKLKLLLSELQKGEGRKGMT